MNLKPLAFGLLGFLALPACAADTTARDDSPAPENVQSTKQAIEDGIIANPFYYERDVRISGGGGKCSGTRIGPYHVITALHCGVAVGDTVRFYTNGSAYPSSSDASRTVEAVGKRPGTSWSVANQSGDLVDENGIFADFAILKLSAAVRGIDYATMAWLYPGDGASGTKVGNGNHEDNTSLFGIVMQKADTTWTSSDADGPFRTSEDAVNPGDSGGAFYHQTRLLGVTSSHDPFHARYTSIPRHLTWILDVINYQWGGVIPPLNGRYLAGALLASLPGKSHIVCQYACQNTASCAGYNYFSPLDQCNLLSSVTSADNGFTGWTSAIR